MLGRWTACNVPAASPFAWAEDLHDKKIVDREAIGHRSLTRARRHLNFGQSASGVSKAFLPNRITVHRRRA